jgi:anaerobic selenocysteine-containing dehydrogenase
VIEPHAQSRSNHEVICALAERLGADHPGFAMTAWEIIDRTLKSSGLPDAETIHGQHWYDCRLSFESMHFLDGFAHPDKRFRFRPDWAALGPGHEAMPRFPDHMAVIDEADEERPFRLVTAPARSFLNSTFTETPGSKAREGRPTALLHTQDLAALGLGPGDAVRIGNGRASVVVHARAFDGLQRGIVVVEGIWPNAAFVEGIGMNALTSADPGYPAGGAAFHDTAVWVRAA